MSRTETTTLNISKEISLALEKDDKSSISEAVVRVIFNLDDSVNMVFEDILNDGEILDEESLMKLYTMLSDGEKGNKRSAINSDKFGLRTVSLNYHRKNGKFEHKIVNHMKKLEDRLRKIISNKLKLEKAITKFREVVTEEYESDIPVPIDYLSTGLMPTTSQSITYDDNEKLTLHIIDANAHGKKEVVKISDQYMDIKWDYTRSDKRIRNAVRRVNVTSTTPNLTKLFREHSSKKISMIFGDDQTIKSDIADSIIGESVVDVSSVSHGRHATEMVIRKVINFKGLSIAIVMLLESNGFPDDKTVVILGKAKFVITVIPLTSNSPVLYASGQAVVPKGVSFSDSDAGFDSPVILSSKNGQRSDTRINDIVRGTDQWSMLNRAFIKDNIVKLLSTQAIKSRLDDRFKLVDNVIPDVNTVLTGIFTGSIEMPDVDVIRKDFRLYMMLYTVGIRLISRLSSIDEAIVSTVLPQIIRDNAGISIMENWVIRCIDNKELIDVDGVNVPIKNLCLSISPLDYLARMTLSLLFTMYIPSTYINEENETPVGTIAYRRLQMMSIPRSMTAYGIAIYAVTRPLLHLVLSADNVTKDFKTLMNNNTKRVKSAKIGRVTLISAKLVKASNADPRFLTVLIDDELMSLENIIRQGVCALNLIKSGRSSVTSAETSFVIWTPQFAIIFTCSNIVNGQREWFVHVISSSRPSRIVKPYHNVSEIMGVNEIYPGMLDTDYGYLNTYVYNDVAH